MNRELSLANAIAHGQGHGQLLAFRCENCHSDRFLIEELGARIGNYHEDVIIERTFALRCTHCGSEEYNRALGERRAISLRNQLVKLGVPDDNMKTVSFGEDRPAVPGTSAEARAKNRRGETIPAKMQ